MKDVIHALPYVLFAGGALLFVNGVTVVFSVNANGWFDAGGNWAGDRGIQHLVMHFGQLGSGIRFAALVFYLTRILKHLELQS